MLKSTKEEHPTTLNRRFADAQAMSDEELLGQYCSTRDPELFESLVKRYERELYNFLRRFLGNSALAEDAFQATFLQLHLKCHLFDERRRVRPWLYTIATNQAIDIQRRNKRHQLVSLDRRHTARQEEIGSLADLLSSRESNPAERLEHGERVQWVRSAVAALPDSLQSVVSLVYFQGLKYREAAEELALPVGTVKSRLHSAVRRLAQAWRET